MARTPLRGPAAALAGSILIGLSGCVERRYTIRTDPPGALVVVNDEEIGPTTASKSFTYYGDRKVTLIADGYQTQTFIQPVKRPWYDNYLTEFFTETLVPWTIRDEREFYYKMTPASAPPIEDVAARGEALRQNGQGVPPPRGGGWFSWLGF